MDIIKHLIASISFDGISPETDDPDIKMPPGSPCNIDWERTIVPEEFRSLSNNIDALCHVPRMSTKAIAMVINALVRNMNPDEAYVNIGVWYGFSLFSGMSGNPGKQCIGIDNFSLFGGPREAFLENFIRIRSDSHIFCEADYRVFFEKLCSAKIGVYFYDGDHSRENQRVVCKAKVRGKTLNPPMFKIKTYQGLTRLKEHCKGDERMYLSLQ